MHPLKGTFFLYIIFLQLCVASLVQSHASYNQSYDDYQLFYGQEVDSEDGPIDFVDVHFQFHSKLKKSCLNDGDCRNILWPDEDDSFRSEDFTYYSNFICSPPYLDPLEYFSSSLKKFMDPIPQGQKASKVYIMHSHSISN